MWERYGNIIGHIEIGGNILAQVPKWILDKNFNRILVVADENTYRAAGVQICSLLEEAGVQHDKFIYGGSDVLTADETAIGKLCAAYQSSHDLILGVGSGTINDLCKFVSFKVNRPCAVAGTAPSMDGYSAKGAAMTVDGMKITPQTQCPSAIFCDIDILKEAPMPMIAAGLGDMLGKTSSLTDWKLSHLLTGEPMPENITNIVSEAIRNCVKSAEGAARREPNAIRHITEGLILSGLAMSLYGDSRPASGTEHHLAHYWEMRAAAERRKPELHGLKVGAATICALKMWKMLPDIPQRPKQENRAAILECVSREYGASAAALLPVPNPNLPFEVITENWQAIMEIARAAPEPGEIARLLKTVGAPLSARGAGIDAKELRDSVLLARERKKTYTVLQLLGDLGLLERFGESLAADEEQ